MDRKSLSAPEALERCTLVGETEQMEEASRGMRQGEGTNGSAKGKRPLLSDRELGHADRDREQMRRE